MEERFHSYEMANTTAGWGTDPSLSSSISGYTHHNSSHGELTLCGSKTNALSRSLKVMEPKDAGFTEIKRLV